MSTWYERNREIAIQRAKDWRLNNLDRFRELNRQSKRRKRAQAKAQRYTPTNIYPLAPEGYDPAIDGDLSEWCLMHNIPNDPSKW